MPLDKMNYPKEDITVIWQPKLCIHSAICFKGLPSVFDPRRKPWVITDNADKDAIIQQVAKCPSGALSTKHV
jgi:uncharacterized Fe-S cluster protein YjdI